MMDNLRLLAASVLANIVGLMFPIKNDMFVLVLLFTVNFVVGLLADVCNRGEWSFRKAFRFFRDAAIYFVMVASIYLLGHLKGEGETAAHCVSFMIYVAMYFYVTNILRNARMITDEKSTQFRVLNFLYYVLSLRVLEKSPWLSKYLDYEKSSKNMV